MSEIPILYSFRRCPYAMRARMAIAISGCRVRLREVVLRDKPAALLEASRKGTVPVVVLPDNTVLEESLDVMHWALRRADPEGWLKTDGDEVARLVAQNDGPFKAALDRYKYANRFPDEDVDPTEQRALGVAILEEWEARLASRGGQLFGDARSFADIAIFPFVRQFANTDRRWFDSLALPALHTWLEGHLGSQLFASVMSKYPQWKEGDEETLFG